MRFVVDVYRYVILAVLACVLIGAVYGGLQLATAKELPPSIMGLYAIGAVALILGFIVLIGVTATIISIHDRHAELVDSISAWREDQAK